MEQNPNLVVTLLIKSLGSLFLWHCEINNLSYCVWILFIEEMQPPHQRSRVNLAELKAQIIRKLGPERSKQYFRYLNGLMSLKLGKVEFNKLCVRIVGRENIPLHNHFIRSILKNAFTAKAPPPTQDVEFLKQKGIHGNKDLTTDGSLANGSHSSIPLLSNPTAITNGDILPVLPRKARTGIRDRRVGDRRSALGPNGKLNSADVILENGESSPHVQHHQELKQQQETRSLDGPLSVHSNEHQDSLVRNLLRAPLGIPYCHASIGGTCRPVLPLPGGSSQSDTVTLKERMEHIVASQGLEGISIDCANALNNGLDAYLKGLIRSSFELVGAPSGLDTTRSSNLKQQNHSKLVNGFRQDHYLQVQGSSSRSLEGPVSLLDFRVAMGLNPQQLGDDWPFLLEKIGTHSFEE